MTSHGLYLLCGKHLTSVKRFLSNFLVEEKTRYTFEDWVTFKIPGSRFKINLMKSVEKDKTQNFVLEVYCKSLKELQKQAKKHKRVIKSFVAKETSKPYRYHYFQIVGPKKICSIEMNYIENKIKT